MRRLGLLALLPLTLVQAQEAATPPASPFFDHPTELRHAYALDLLSLQLDTLELELPAGVEDEMEEDVPAEAAEAGEEGEEGEEEGLVGTALPLLAGTLGATDAALLAELEAAFGATETGDPARELLSEVEAALIPQALLSETAFRAARLALLSSLEPGVGEGYEEAAQGESEAYLIGYTGLQKIKADFGTLELTGDISNIERAFTVLDDLMPTPELPDRFSDPEDAEVAVNDVIFGLEALTGTSLIPRDFAAMLSAIGAHADEGCAAAEAGDTALALEWATAADFFYSAYLSNTLEMLAAEPNASITEELGEFAEDPASDQTSARCENIRASIEEASSVFGG